MNKSLKGLLLSILILTLSFNMLPLGAQNVEGGKSIQSEIATEAGVTLTAAGSRLQAKVIYATGANLINARVYTYIQKYVDGVWRAASSVPTECGWLDESTDFDGTYYHYFTMTEKAQYRVKVVFYFYGPNNVMDRIEKYDFYTYNG